MLTGLATLMIARPHRLTLHFLAAILSPGVRTNRGLLLDPLRKLNIARLLMALQKHWGSLHFFMNLDFHWKCHLLYCVIILAQLTLVLIRFTTQEWSISKSIFTLCVIKFRRVLHVHTQDQLVDLLTKPLSRTRTEFLRAKIGLADGSSILRGHIKEDAKNLQMHAICK
jgi:hypothetical protein